MQAISLDILKKSQIPVLQQKQEDVGRKVRIPVVSPGNFVYNGAAVGSCLLSSARWKPSWITAPSLSRLSSSI